MSNKLREAIYNVTWQAFMDDKHADIDDILDAIIAEGASLNTRSDKPHTISDFLAILTAAKEKVE